MICYSVSNQVPDLSESLKDSVHMSFKVGIVGLPNVGKSTLFKAVTKKQVESENYPFCTIDPNIGVVEVPDRRLEAISRISSSERTVHTTIEFVDIAGLVRGAHQGRGLGNKFLAHIREVDAIVEVTRGFEDNNVIHTENGVNPERDKEIIDFELMVADLQTVDGLIEKFGKDLAKDNESFLKVNTLKKAKEFLEKEKPLRDMELSAKEREAIKEFNFLTNKPIIHLKNVDGVPGNKEEDFLKINAKMEAEMAGLSEKDMEEYMKAVGLKESGLSKLIRKSYNSLNLVSFFTSGEKETRAWTVKKGSLAPAAAGKIHSDFEREFIRAEVANTDEFIKHEGWSNLREVGKVKDKGKHYEVQDGDIIFFKTSA